MWLVDIESALWYNKNTENTQDGEVQVARKRVEWNISYDDVRKKFYVNLDFGFGTNGKQLKKTQTFSTITEARKALHAHSLMISAFACHH